MGSYSFADWHNLGMLHPYMLHLYAGLGLLAITLKESNALNRFCQVASFSVFTVIERKSSKECSIGKQIGMLCNVLHSH